MHARPAKWSLFVFYCITLIVVYAACFVGGLAILGLALSGEFSGSEEFEMYLTGAMLCIVSVPFLVFSAAAPFLPQKKWAYVYHICMIALGMTSCCWWPLVLPLLVEWVKPEVKEWYEPELDDVFS